MVSKIKTTTVSRSSFPIHPVSVAVGTFEADSAAWPRPYLGGKTGNARRLTIFTAPYNTLGFRGGDWKEDYSLVRLAFQPLLNLLCLPENESRENVSVRPLRTKPRTPHPAQTLSRKLQTHVAAVSLKSPPRKLPGSRRLALLPAAPSRDHVPLNALKVSGCL